MDFDKSTLDIVKLECGKLGLKYHGIYVTKSTWVLLNILNSNAVNNLNINPYFICFTNYRTSQVENKINLVRLDGF